MNRILSFVFLFFPLALFSQVDSILKPGEVKFFPADTKVDSARQGNHSFAIGVFISAGITGAQYYSDNFFNYLASKTASPSYGSYGSAVSSNSGKLDINGSYIPNVFQYDKLLFSPSINLGIEFISSKDQKVHHLIEANYLNCSGEFSGSANYQEHWYAFGSPANGFSQDIKDTIRSKFNQTLLSLGYRFQPTYKFLFFSLGMNCTVNLIKTNQNRVSYINGAWYDEFAGTSLFSHVYSSDTVRKFCFINFPLQLGVGGNLNINRVLLKPAFYFSSCFMKGYNFYNLSLGIMYDFKKRS